MNKRQISRAVQRCRGEGWTVRRQPGERYRVAQRGDVREFTVAELLAFAGIEAG